MSDVDRHVEQATPDGCGAHRGYSPGCNACNPLPSDVTYGRDLSPQEARAIFNMSETDWAKATHRALLDRNEELVRENAMLSEKLREMTARAVGHAYATSMAEGGETIQHQELQYERRWHGETLATLRKYECALTSIVEAARAAQSETPDQ